jgi:hypothetical protein
LSGYNGFVVRLKPDGSAPIYSTYLGPGANPNRALLFDVAVDASGIATVTGYVDGSGYPVTPGAYKTVLDPYEIVVTRLSPRGDALLYSTYLGSGLGTEEGYGIAMNPARRVTVAGFSNGGYPTTPNAAFPTYQGGQTDGVVTNFDLVFIGVELSGASTPSCHGPLALNTTEMPAAGAGNFAFNCSGAPPQTGGWLLLGQASATTHFVKGVALSMDLTQPITRIPVTTNRDGYVRTPFTLPPGSQGQKFSCQYFLRNTSACGGQGTWCGSNALTITVQ